LIARQIGIVLCRVGAAVLTVQAIRSLGYSLPGLLFGDREFWSEMVAFSFLGAAPGLAAIGLWVFADRISSLSDPFEVTESPKPLSGLDIVRIGTTLIGVYVLVMGITTGANVEVLNLVRPDLGSEYQSTIDEQTARTIGSRASYFVQILLGLALIIGRERLSIMLVKVKYAGVKTR
jgi:hypothetical protein